MNRFLLLTSFVLLLSAANYPDHWWKPVPEGDLASWEIGPQAAVKGKEVVLSKRNELGILSNFGSTPFELDGLCSYVPQALFLGW